MITNGDPIFFATVGSLIATKSSTPQNDASNSRAGTPRADSPRKKAVKKGKDKADTPRRDDEGAEETISSWPIRICFYELGDMLCSLLPSIRDTLTDPFASELAKNYFLSLSIQETETTVAPTRSKAAIASSKHPSRASRASGSRVPTAPSRSTTANRNQRGGRAPSRASEARSKSRGKTIESLQPETKRTWNSSPKFAVPVSYQERLGAYLMEGLSSAAERKARMDSRRKEGLTVLNTS